MRKCLAHWLTLSVLAFGLLLGAAVASAQPCCECRCPRNEEPACSAAFGLDDDAYLAAVCEPLGCAIAVCTNKACSQVSRCPRTEAGRCADGFDNDADGKFDCDDSNCAGTAECMGGPSPTPPPGGTPGTPVPTSPVTPVPTGPGTAVATPTKTPATPAPTAPPASPTSGGSRDCCVGRDASAGCEILACERCVCGVDSFCCDTIWDVNCASIASSDCARRCQCPTPTRTPVRSPGTTSDCCVGRGEAAGPGCSVPACEGCVCDVDDFCCGSFWDQSCADIARDECLTTCACDGSGPVATAPPTPTKTGSPGGATRSPTRVTSPTRAGSPTRTRSPCTSSNDCPRGFVCTTSGACVAATPSSSGGGGGGGSGGCAVEAPVDRGSPFVWLVLLALLCRYAGAWRRRE
jgi:hypothetical protein